MLDRSRLLIVAVAVGLVLGMFPASSAPLDSDQKVEDSTLEDLASDLYGVDHVAVYNLNNTSDWDTAFPEYEVYRVVELTSHPATVHAMARNPDDPETLEYTYDVTDDINDLMADAGLDIQTSDRAIEIARAYADTANLELQPNRTVVDSTDSDWLGYQVDDPQADAIVGGWRVELSTWAPENGVLGNWTIDVKVDSLDDAEWLVAEMGLADSYNPEYEALNLEQYDRFVNDYGSGHTLSATEFEGGESKDLRTPSEVESIDWTAVDSTENFDGSTWTVYKESGGDVSSVVVDALLSAGNWSYQWLVDRSSAGGCSSGSNPNASWGYVSPDSDCNHEIRIVPDDAVYCGACVDEGNETTIYVAETLLTWMENSAKWYRSDHPYDWNDTARLTVGHEFMVQLSTQEPAQLPEINPIEGEADYVRDSGQYDGTLDPEHTALRTIYTDMFQTIRLVYNDKENVTSVSPALNGTGDIHVVVEDKIPDDLHKEIVPRHWDLKFYTNLTDPNFQDDETNLTTNLSTENATKLDDSEIPDDSEGIRPGSLLLVGCTSNFIWQDDGGTYYLGLAGHCYDSTSETAWVCIEDCHYGPLTQEEECTNNHVQSVPIEGEINGLEDPPLPNECVDMHGNFTSLPVSYRILGDHDQEFEDFGLAEIPDSKEDLIVPRMKVWGGPSSGLEECPQDVVPGTEDLAGDDALDTVDQIISYAGNHSPQVPPPVVLYGHAAAVGEVWPTKARAGFFKECTQHPYDSSEDDGYSAWLPASFGDSGASVNLANVTADGVLKGREALGVETRFDTHHQGLAEGPIVPQQKRIAQDEWGLNITVVSEGDTIN